MKQTKNKKLWFRAKWYGWGWYPSTWQGFIIILLSILILVFFWLNLMKGENILINSLAIIVDFIILLRICYLKGEKPRWRWGK
jgi:hypothetical protein